MQARRREFLWAMAAMTLGGCHELQLNPFKMQDQKEVKRKNVRDALRVDGQPRLIGDYIRFADSTLAKIKVQGIGLVDRLDGTGEDPPSSPNRTRLLEDMRRHQIREPQAYLASQDTAMVIVTAYIDPVMKKDERIDVELTLPDGSEATSLAGGWLMPCFLREYALMEGEVHSGKEIAVASGPVLIDVTQQSESSFGGLRRGRIPSGGQYLGEDRTLMIGIASDYQTVRMATNIADRVGRRFFDYDGHGIQRPLAKAKTDQLIELTVHDRYRDNWPRYIQCIRHMTLTESPVERHIRIQRLAEEIDFGPTSERAALQLEAVGPESIPVLKQGLRSPDLEARLHCGIALAYLGNADGVPALREAAEKEPALRIHALAGLAALTDGAAGEALEYLMNQESVETRYGAFRALCTMAPEDPMVQGIPLSGNFRLHLVDSTASPLVHITRFRKAEVVLFGAEQEFLMPLILRAGSRIIVQGQPHERQVVIKRIAAGEPIQEQRCAPRVSDVIQTAAELGAQYPDIVEMLIQAEKQKNLPGRVAVDQLPRSGRVYHRPQSNSSQRQTAEPVEDSVQVGSPNLTPTLFDEQTGEIREDDLLPEIPLESKSTEPDDS